MVELDCNIYAGRHMTHRAHFRTPASDVTRPAVREAVKNRLPINLVRGEVVIVSVKLNGELRRVDRFTPSMLKKY